MSDESQQGTQYDPDEDQDTEATMTAPPEGRPDGIDWDDAGSDVSEASDNADMASRVGDSEESPQQEEWSGDA